MRQLQKAIGLTRENMIKHILNCKGVDTNKVDRAQTLIKVALLDNDLDWKKKNFLDTNKQIIIETILKIVNIEDIERTIDLIKLASLDPTLIWESEPNRNGAAEIFRELLSEVDNFNNFYDDNE